MLPWCSRSPQAWRARRPLDHSVAFSSSPPPQEYLQDSNKLFALWLAEGKDLGQLNAPLERKRITSKLGRTSYSSKKAREILAMYAGDTQKADVLMSACRRRGRFADDP